MGIEGYLLGMGEYGNKEMVREIMNIVFVHWRP